MTFVPLAAALIRRSVVDETYAQDLQDSVAADQTVFEGLVHAPIEEDDLGWLSPRQWHWFARWRQGQGGGLDTLLLDYLAFSGKTHDARFELRSLVMRDRRTEEQAPTADAMAPQPETLGLRWLQEHARGFPNSLEVAYDALQIATESAWFTLRVLTALDDIRGSEVRRELERFAEQRGISREVTNRWTTRG